jgi:hypothetical protein
MKRKKTSIQNMAEQAINCQLSWKQSVNRMQDSILPTSAYSYNLEGQKTRENPKVYDEISSTSPDHENGLVTSSPSN